MAASHTDGPTAEGEYWGPTFANADPIDSQFTSRTGLKVHYRRWICTKGAARARVIGCHGYGDHAGRFVAPTQ
jgi:alpha-beta hydrolase superfamily lysophospholipase